MKTNQQHFAELFEASGGVLTEELQDLFQTILVEDFNDNPELMTAFMESLQKPQEVPPTPTEQQLEMLQETVLQLSELMMGGL